MKVVEEEDEEEKEKVEEAMYEGKRESEETIEQ